MSKKSLTGFKEGDIVLYYRGVPKVVKITQCIGMYMVKDMSNGLEFISFEKDLIKISGNELLEILYGRS